MDVIEVCFSDIENVYMFNIQVFYKLEILCDELIGGDNIIIGVVIVEFLGVDI